jgi:3-oxoadipate enol-lactonase
MAQYADDAAALLDALGHACVDVVGVSFGGMVAQHMALLHGARIRKLVLCCTSPGGRLPSYPFHTLPDDLDPVERARMLMGVNDLRLDSSWQHEHPGRVEKMLELLRKGSVPEHDTPEARRGARLQLEARAGHDVLDRLGRIDRPTLLCAGRYDGIAPVASQEALASGIPHAELRWYEGGHMFLLQDRSAWTDIIGFLGSGPSG